LGNDIVVVHVKDIVIENGQKAWRNIGAGSINYELIFKWLSQHNPDIRLLREGVKMDSYHEDQQAMARFADLRS
jgi:sugar phosphate isomerase/epimerase